MSEFKSTKDKLNAVHEILNNGLEEMFHNNEKFQRFLELMSRFPNYSLNNLALIYAQKPNATMVQGFKQWKRLERYVNKGEKGLYIYAPSFKNKKEVVKDEHGNPIKDEKGKDKVTIKKVITGYIPVKVFDISQTGGKELPKAKDFVHDVKTGQKSMDYNKLYELVKDAIQENAKVSINDQTITPFLKEHPTVKGYYNLDKNEIVIRNDLSIEHKFKTLIHEFAHSQLHAENSPFKDSSKSEKEIHAESVAFCVSNYYGLDTSDYSVGYIATWARDLDKAKQGLNQIKSMVEGTVKSIDNIISQHELELLSENKIDHNENSSKKEETEKSEDKSTVVNQVESSLEVHQEIKEFEPIEDYKELFTNAVPSEYIENFTKNMDLTNNENPPVFEILDKQTLSFVTGQFVKEDPESENYEFQVHGEKILTGKDFETGDYLITNLLSDGTNINIYTKAFDDQFFIDEDEKNNEYNISVYKADGNKEVICTNDHVKGEQGLEVIKAQYDYMAVEKTANQSQFADTMMKRVDLAFDKNKRDQLASSYEVLDKKVFIEDKNTLDRRYHDANIPQDRNTVMLLTEYLRASPLVNSLEELQENIERSSEKASQRLGMNRDIYSLMLSNSVNQVIDNTMNPKHSVVDQIDKNTIVLTREEDTTKSYIDSLKVAEKYSSENNEPTYQNIAHEKLERLLKMNQLDSPAFVTDQQKIISRNEATSYKFTVSHDGGEKSVAIADNSGTFPYLIQKDKAVNLKDVLSKTSGVQALSLPEREENANRILGNVINNDDKKKETVTERESEDLAR
ncbi:ArdC family protein [Bacillus sonorensis]|uniref:ArdC family protein n=1 Tax=Bacillus subtilis group TaxID=653685 RepID=UPI001FD65786|nr:MULTISPECIES: ArdC family protein [Bacillus subtilis group]MCJ8223706.1 ArdC family protein [Bacillus paralicheniformis]MEC0526231.1 ArdC family protein [Bacillus sonorensis]